MFWGRGKVSSASRWMFLIGLGGQTQFHFFGSIGVSEFPIYLLAPIVFVQDYNLLRRDGFLPWIWLSILTCVGCLVASFANNINFIFVLKGLATPYSIFAVGVVFHRFIRRDLMSFRWFLIGFFLSGIVCTFVFQPETYTLTQGAIAQGDEAVEMMISHPLYWTSRIAAILQLPVNGWYLNVPHLYSFLVVFGAGIISILFSGSSGRSSFAISIVTSALILFGGKSRRRMRTLGNKLWILAMLGLILTIGIKTAYKQAAKTGILGEEALEKYEKQTSRGDSMLKILMAGRKEFFIAMSAGIDKPILGHGPKAEDTSGYAEAFLLKYGDDADYRSYAKSVLDDQRRGFTYRVIPTHSYIGSFWVYYGIFGLVYWIYVLYLMWRYFQRYSASVPQWFGYQCTAFFGMIWGIFFSPYGQRLSAVLPIVVALFAKAVYEKRFVLPWRMELEAQRA